MTFYAALFAWLVIAAIFTVGIVMATKGTFWLLILCTVLFVAAFSKWGCKTSH